MADTAQRKPTAADQWIDRMEAEARRRQDEGKPVEGLWDYIESIRRSRLAGDPWYVTASKAVIGPNDYQKVYEGSLGPWFTHLSPFIVTGARKAPIEMPGLRPRVPILSRAEMELPPETKTLLDAVRSYEPPAAPPPRYNPHDVFNWEALPFSPRPEPPIKITPQDLLVDPMTEHQNLIKSLDNFFGDDAKAKGMADAIKGMYEDYYNEHGWPPGMEAQPPPPLPLEDPLTPKDFYMMQDLGTEPPKVDPNFAMDAWDYYLKNLYKPWDVANQPGGLDALWWPPGEETPPLPPMDIPPRPFPPNLNEPPPPEPPIEFMSSGGVAGIGIGDPYQMPGPSLEDDDTISIIPDWRYIPSGDFGAEDIPPSPDYPPPPPAETPEEFIDSADYIGGANYWYSEPPRSTPVPQTVNNYYGAADESHAQRQMADLSSAIGLPPPTKTSNAELLRMMAQQNAMAEAGRRYDAAERRARLKEQMFEQATRFGPLIQNDINREYMKDFFPPGFTFYGQP